MDITIAQSSFKNKFIESAVIACTFMFCINALVKQYPKRRNTNTLKDVTFCLHVYILNQNENFTLL